jgi:alkylation response protein AidB-like acyl-CoA dehydrogenase
VTAVDTDMAAQILTAARELAPRIAARSEEIEQTRRIPDDIVQALKDTHIFRMFQPRVYGGAEVDPLTAITVEEGLAHADGSVGWCLTRALAGGILMAQLEPEAAHEIYDPDPSIVIAGTLQPPGEAIVVDGGYRVSGRWPFGSGCQHASWMQGVCRVIENGEVRLAANGQPELRAFNFPASEVEILDTWYATGLRGTGSHDYQVRDVFVPNRQSIVFGQPVVRAQGIGPLYRAYPLMAFPAEGAFAIGVAQRALDEFIELAERKTPFMATQVLREQSGVQETVAEAQALISSSRHYLHAATRELWQAMCEGGDGTPQQRAELRLAVAHAMHTAVRAVDLIHAAAGTTAIYARSPIERCFRDLHTAEADVVVGRGVYRTAGRLVLGLPITVPNW